MRTNTNAIGNRPIDNLIEQKRAYERLKAKNAKLRSNNLVNTNNEIRSDVINSQEESNNIQDKNKGRSKHRHGHKSSKSHVHSNGRSHGHSHHHSKRT